jgi:hypothetical protein
MGIPQNLVNAGNPRKKWRNVFIGHGYPHFQLE